MEARVQRRLRWQLLPDSASGLHMGYPQRRLNRRVGPLKQLLGIASFPPLDGS
jgi:hypothetical protein